MRRAGVVLSLMLSLPAGAEGQTPLTLDEAIGQALQHSARLAELAARRDGATAAVRGRAAERLPIVSLHAGYTRTNHVDEFAIALPAQPVRVLYPDIPNNVRSRIDLQWPIYTAGRVDALERAARGEAGTVGEELAASRADLALEVTRAFIALITARETEAVLARSLDRMDVHLKDLRARLDQGLISPHEVLSAEAQRARQQVATIEGRAARARAQADLRRLTGVTADAIDPVMPPGTLLETRQDAVNTARQGMGAERAEVRALKQRVEAARARLAAARAARRPQVVAAAGYEYARPNPRIFPRRDRWDASWDVSLNLAWTLWNGGRTAAGRAEADAAVRAAEARATEFSRQAALDLEVRALELDAARAAVPAADHGVRAAREAQRVTAERYSAGVAQSADLVDAETAVLQAELDRLRARANVYVAETALLHAAGRLQ